MVCLVRALLVTHALVATAVAATPTATACTVTTTTASVCAIEFDYESGDTSCESDGFHWQGTLVVVQVPGTGEVRFYGDRYCSHQGDYEAGAETIGGSVFLYNLARVSAQYRDYEDQYGDRCTLIASAYVIADGTTHEGECRGGTQTPIPWGDLLPN